MNRLCSTRWKRRRRPGGDDGDGGGGGGGGGDGAAGGGSVDAPTQDTSGDQQQSSNDSESQGNSDNAPPEIPFTPPPPVDICGLAGGCDSNPPAPPGYVQCVTEALQEQEVVAHAEGMDNRPNDGYGTLVHGTVIAAPPQYSDLIGTRNAVIANPSTLSGNTGFMVRVNSKINSSAFGRYQILGRTADSLGMTNMSSESQDQAAATLMSQTNMISAAMSGNIQQAILNGNTTWASLPGSPYGQPTISMANALSTYQNALQTLPDCQ